jgi:hypothetical protein
MSDAPKPESDDLAGAPAIEAPAPAAAVAPATETETAAAAPAMEQPQDELVVLDQLEADLAAVEQAISTLEQVAGDGIGGEQAAAQIAAAVSADRFGGAAV